MLLDSHYTMMDPFLGQVYKISYLEKLQIILLNNRIESYKTRYHRAIEANRHSFLYSIRIQLQVLEITRNLFYDSAKNISMIIEGHQQKFLELTGRFLTNVEIETGLLSTD